jgi:prepilin-type processing-associated H-X9-DG protein
MLQISSRQRSDGTTVHSWVVAPLAIMQIMPCWTTADKHLVVASNAALCDLAVKQVVSKGRGGESIRTTEGYKKATAKIPANVVSLRYCDSKIQFKQVKLGLQGVWPMITMAAANANIKLPAVLPSLDSVIEQMGPSCCYCWFDSDGLHSRYQGSGFEAMSVAGASLGVGILMPALARTREVAKRMTSGTNLAGIGKACLIYANDHDDKLPPNLEELIEKCDLSPKTLESPLKPKGFDGPSYIYIAGQTTSMEPGNIVAYENPEFCTEGVNVLFMDCHVSWVKRDEFLHQLEETYKRLGREMPEIKFKDTKKPVPADKIQPAPMPVEN